MSWKRFDDIKNKIQLSEKTKFCDIKLEEMKNIKMCLKQI